MKPYKYPGELGKASNPLAIPFGTGQQLGPYWLPFANPAARNSAQIDRHAQLMLMLLDHFAIDRNSPHKWYDLAFRLAHAHVPAFCIENARGPGRPRKSLTREEFFASTLGGFRRRGTPGRKRNEAQHVERRKLLVDVHAICRDQNLTGPRAPGKALKVLAEARARANGRYSLRKVRDVLHKLRPELSKAKKEFPEIAAKLPR